MSEEQNQVETVLEEEELALPQDAQFYVKTYDGKSRPLSGNRGEAYEYVKRCVNALRETDVAIATYEAEIIACAAKRMRHLDSLQKKAGEQKAVQESLKMDFIEQKRIKPLKQFRKKILGVIAKPWELYTARHGSGIFIAYWLDTNGNLLKAMQKSGVDHDTAKEAIADWRDFLEYSGRLKRKRL